MVRRPPLLGTRALVFLAIVVAGLVAAVDLGWLAPRAGGGGREVAGEFLSSALRPALVSEAPSPFGGDSLLPDLLKGMRNTVVFAAAALALAAAAGFVLGFFGSTAWWSGETEGSAILRRFVGPAIYSVTRVVIALLRSVHELLWAVMLLSAFGRSDFTAVLAIAIPYAGTVAKIFSEIVDEAPRGAAIALRTAGASPTQVFVFGLMPRALPDTAAYLFYQFECALRSSAILGFFGFPTLGFYISQSFENLYYGEVWTWLYGLLALILVVEIWSGALRKRLVG